jgi:hypothetical protein
MGQDKTLGSRSKAAEDKGHFSIGGGGETSMLDGTTIPTSSLSLLSLGRSSSLGFYFLLITGRSLGISGTGGTDPEGVGSEGDLNDLFVVPSLLRQRHPGRKYQDNLAVRAFDRFDLNAAHSGTRERRWHGERV